jgi:hypothetical protein
MRRIVLLAALPFRNVRLCCHKRTLDLLRRCADSTNFREDALISLGIADVLADGVAMRSHDRILSGPRAKLPVLLTRHQDKPRSMMKYMAMHAAITTAMNVRFRGSLVHGRRALLNILSSLTAGIGVSDRCRSNAHFVHEEPSELNIFLTLI